MKNVLITGGAGFIGSHVCRMELEAGHRVCCMDNFYTGSKGNVSSLLGKDFRVREGNVCDGVDLSEMVAVYHLACPASPVHYQRDAVGTWRTCVLGMLRVLEALRDRGKGTRLLFASTSEVYGDPQQHPQTEDYWGNVNPLGVRSCYDEGKRASESLLMDYYRQYGVDVCLVRIFNTYGPFMQPDDGRVVSNFICQALRNKPLTLYGSGLQTRSFCYVSDLVEGMHLMMNKEGLVGPVNLGNPTEINMLELADTIRELTNSRSDIKYLPAREDEPRQRCPDIGLAERQLGWKPKVGLREGLVPTIAFFEKCLR